MPGAIEELTFTEQVKRLNKMAETLVRILKNEKKAMDVKAALVAAAQELDVDTAQVNYGLNYAYTQGLVEVNDRARTVQVAA